MTSATDHKNSNGKPVGAVMVVGGGIAGMQASLDLADQGYKVYMIEKETAMNNICCGFKF